MTADVRRHVVALYAESNEQTARALTAQGYRNLPAWLATGASQQPAEGPRRPTSADEPAYQGDPPELREGIA